MVLEKLSSLLPRAHVQCSLGWLLASGRAELRQITGECCTELQFVFSAGLKGARSKGLSHYSLGLAMLMQYSYRLGVNSDYRICDGWGLAQKVMHLLNLCFPSCCLFHERIFLLPDLSGNTILSARYV